MNQWLSFILSKQFLKHFLLIVIAFIIFILILFKWFNVYTLHGKSITLNDLNELTMNQAIELLESKGLNYEIVDSSSFNPEFLPHAIIQQNPAPNSKVKDGRTVYLWLNAGAPPYKKIPCLADDADLSEANQRLEQLGFSVGEITYKPVEGIKKGNPILELHMDGKKISCGDKAQFGTKIDLIVGEKAGANKVDVPFLLGKTLAEAEFIMNADLNFGTIIYDTEGLIDSSSMVIYKQLPDVGNEPLRIGGNIDVWLIQDLPEEVALRIQNLLKDTTNITPSEEVQ